MGDAGRNISLFLVHSNGCLNTTKYAKVKALAIGQFPKIKQSFGFFEVEQFWSQKHMQWPSVELHFAEEHIELCMHNVIILNCFYVYYV